MTAKQSLLIELGTEELPPKALDELSRALLEGVQAGLAKRGIAYEPAGARALNSPRRLAVLIDAVAVAQPEQAMERRGPAVAQALDASGQPSRALLGFASSCGVDVDALQRLETDKGAWFVHRSISPGQATVRLLPEILYEALKSLPIPRPMRWSDLEYEFVRPVHWLLFLFGNEPVPACVFGLDSDRLSRGHRFHHPGAIAIATPGDYVAALRAARVLVDPLERRQRIEQALTQAAATLGGQVKPRPELLAEVNNLVEWPVAITGSFEREFLKVPQAALITTMENNQKFFPVFDAGGQLTEHFIGIANIESRDPAVIRQGYERVIRPRFADARFFFDEDLKTPLAAHQQALAAVTYQQKLGSIGDKVGRVGQLAQVVGRRMQDLSVMIELPQLQRAVALSKCDLMTRMVGEFPELQGSMGCSYALAQGEPTAIATALDQYYRPRFAGDAIATDAIARALAIADKLDTLAGMFAIGNRPSGGKDPFSLRRTALGLARTLIESGLDLDLVALIEDAIDQAKRALGAQTKTAIVVATEPCPPWQRSLDRDVIELYDFIVDRLRGYYQEQGVGAEQFESVAVLKPTSLTEFDQRLRAVLAFCQMPEAASLAAANKRIGNILRQAVEKQLVLGVDIDPQALQEGAESDFQHALVAAEAELAPLLGAGDYLGALARLAALREPIDAFFIGVMVMADDPAQRQNRLNGLNRLRRLFTKVADISLLP